MSELPLCFRRQWQGCVTVAASLLVAGILATSASAQTATQTLQVSAGIVDGCEVSGQAGSTLGGATLDFGSRDQLAPGMLTAVTASSGAEALTIRCNNASTLVALTFGMGQNANGATRRLAAGGTYVDYELFRDAAFSQPIGSAPVILGGFTANIVQTVAVYGRVPTPLQATAQSMSAPTLYTDQISLTVTF